MAFGYTGNFLGVIDSSIIAIGAAFLIFFAFLNYVLSKIFRDRYGNTNKATAGIIAFSISVLIVYYGQNTLNNLITGLNIGTNILSIVLGIIFIIGSIWAMSKIGFKGFLMVLGIGLIIVGFTDLVYRKGFVLVAGAVLFLIGIALPSRRRLNGEERVGLFKGHEIVVMMLFGGISLIIIGLVLGNLIISAVGLFILVIAIFSIISINKKNEQRRYYEHGGPSDKYSGYRKKARKLKAKEEYLYYKEIEKQRETKERQIEKRYKSRHGTFAWTKRKMRGI